MNSGKIPGWGINNRLFRPVSPESSWILDLATLKLLAKKAIRCLLALPSTGGAVMRILMKSSLCSAKASLAARGCTRTLRIKFSFCQLKNTELKAVIEK